MQIVKLKLAELAPNTGQIPGLPINPRQWTKGDVDKIAASLKETPELFEARPVLVIPHDGKYVILGGNLRYEGARANKEKEVPAIIFPEDTPVEKLKEVVIKDNGAFGAWDYDALANEWDDLPLGDWGVPAWSKEEEKSLDGISDEVKEDEFDEDVETRCQPGDIWQLGDHRLMCGDSTDLDTVKSLMGGGLADMVFTDPPYGVTQQKWDIVPNLDNMFSCMLSVSREDAALLIFSTQPFTTDLITARKDLFRYDIIWRKTAPTGFYDAHKRPLRIHEIICVFYRMQPCFFPQKTVVQGQTGIGRKRGNSNYMKTCGGSWGTVGREKAESYEYEEDGTRYPTSVIECSNWNGTLFGDTSRSVVHPTQKPVALADYMLKSYSQEGDIVLDLFGGSGTTLIAAEQLGRKARLMEIDPHYCDVILARWEKLTGQTATKL